MHVWNQMIHAYDFIPFLYTCWRQPVPQRPPLGHLRQACNVHADGRALVFSCRERFGPHPGRVPRGPLPALHCGRVWRWAAEQREQQIWLLVRSNPTSCAQDFKRLVASITALLILSPYGRPSRAYSRIVAIEDARDLNVYHQTNEFTLWIKSM
jgi:hypothetical protein